MATFRKAQRSKAKLRLAVCGVSGGGKTYSSLLIASGITSWDKIAVIDSENGSADLYAHLGDYSVLTISPPYTPEKYTQAIQAAEQEGFEVIIIDSLTHAWAGDGGLLDKKGAIEKRTGNGWTAWRDITPQHNRLVESILQSKCHVIATLRAKMDYVQEKKGDKTVISKVGMNPIQREGMEYEFTVFFDIDTNHVCTSSKDRTSLFDGQYFKPDQKTGKQLLDWLETGVEAPIIKPETIKTLETPKHTSTEIKPKEQPNTVATVINEGQIKSLFIKATKEALSNEDVHGLIKHKYGIVSVKELLIPQFSELMNNMSKLWMEYVESQSKAV